MTASGPTAAPFGAFERMVAGRYLGARRREAFISVIGAISFLGITLGVATLIIVMAVMNGFRQELLTRILGVSGQVVVEAADTPLGDYEDLSALFATIPGVAAAMPLVEGQALASGRFGVGNGVRVRGLSEADLKATPLIAKAVTQGELAGFDTGEGVVIGQGLAELLGLGIGDNLTLVAPETAEAAAGLDDFPDDADIVAPAEDAAEAAAGPDPAGPEGEADVAVEDTEAVPAGPGGVSTRVKAYRVAAIFAVGMPEFDDTVVFMPFAEAQLFFHSERAAQAIELFLDDPYAVDAVRPVVAETAGRPLRISDWRENNKTFFDALQVERNLMFMALALIVLVAALNIVSGLVMMVKDKSRDIGILRTIGATRAAVLRVFIMAGSAIGISGTLAGLVLGIVFCLNIDALRGFFALLSGNGWGGSESGFFSRMPAVMDPAEIVAIVILALALTLIASTFPAWRAARLDPVAALRSQ